MDAILDICRRKRIELIEDCAHASGGDYKGKPLGTFGTISCWSFFSNKNISVGEGGMFVTADEKLERRARLLRSHGMSHATLDRFLGRAISYDVEIPGLNYRIDEIRAAVGLVQLVKLAEANKQRELLVKEYHTRLEGAAGVILPFRDFDLGSPAYHIMPVLLEQLVDRSKVIAHMKANGIQTSIHYPSFRQFTAFRDADLGATPIADYISEHELTLPLYPTMSQVDLVLTCEALEAAIQS
jgi:dTDP-4-amino-4,6-dideoxygalactose transaminase